MRKRQRRSETRLTAIQAKGRKLVLVGYSYGGLVIKKAVVLARGNPDFEYVVENTQAIIFLGTPHRGSTFSSWGRRVAGLLRLVGSNPFILAEIEYDSTMLLDLHLGFEVGIGTETQIVNVFEQRPTLLFRFWFFQWKEFVRTSTGSSFQISLVILTLGTVRSRTICKVWRREGTEHWPARRPSRSEQICLP